MSSWPSHQELATDNLLRYLASETRDSYVALGSMTAASHGTDDYLQLLGTYPPTGSQTLRINMVVSLDGKIDVDGRSKGLSTNLDRQIFHFLRATAQVILVGAGTARAENYQTPKLTDELVELRHHLGITHPLRIVVASREANPVASSTEIPNGTIEYLQIPSTIDNPGLSALLGVDNSQPGGVLCEGGPTLLGDLLTRDLVDEFCLTIRHLIAGASSELLVTREFATPIDFELAGHITSAQATFLRLVKRR